MLNERLQKDDFFKHAADLNSLLTHVKARVREAVSSLSDQQKMRLKDGAEDLQRLPQWGRLTQEERSNALAQLEALSLSAAEDLAGLKKLLARDYEISTTVEELKRSIIRQDEERRLQDIKDETEAGFVREPRKMSRSVPVPSKITTPAQLDALIAALSELKMQIAMYDDLDVSFTLMGIVGIAMRQSWGHTFKGRRRSQLKTPTFGCSIRSKTSSVFVRLA